MRAGKIFITDLKELNLLEKVIVAPVRVMNTDFNSANKVHTIKINL